MSADRLTGVLAANDNCLTRYGVRRTMDDIAPTGVSRSAVHQHVRREDHTFRQPAGHLHGRIRSHKNAYIYLYGV